MAESLYNPQFLADFEAALVANGSKRGVDSGDTRMYQCPIHDDSKQSLAVSEGEDGKPLIYCHSCSSDGAKPWSVVEEIAAEIGVDTETRFIGNGSKVADVDWATGPEAIYDYRKDNLDSEKISYLFSVLRFPGKQFRQVVKKPQSINGRSITTARGGWKWRGANGVDKSIKGIERTIYRQPKVHKALKAGEPVYIVEGERDVQTLEGMGLVATCNPGGAGKWRPEFSKVFRGTRSPVVIIPDMDGPTKKHRGERHALAVADSLRAVEVEAKFLRAAQGKDASDHAAAGLGVAEFVALDHLALAQPIGDGDSAEQDAKRAQMAEEAFSKMRAQEDGRRLFRAYQAAERAKVVTRERKMDGETFVWSADNHSEVLWGYEDAPLCLEGEGTLLVGGDGVGKTTVAQQLILRRVGIGGDTFLDMPVAEATGRIVYLAMDRPDQISRSLRRMVSESDRSTLRERLGIWRGPIPFDVGESSHALYDWLCNEFGSDVSDVVVDSYKDLVQGLSDEPGGMALNGAMQACIASGVQWFGLHHPRKPTADRKRDYDISDVYGCRWVTAGTGSVFFLLGEAGASAVELRHVKPLRQTMPSLLLQHDHAAGISARVEAARDVAEVLLSAGVGVRVTTNAVAKAMYGSDDDRYLQRARGHLKKLVSEGYAEEFKAHSGGAGGSTPAGWAFKEPS
jgi:hypothetical protein